MKFLIPIKNNKYFKIVSKALKAGLEKQGQVAEIILRNDLSKKEECIKEYDFVFVFTITGDWIRDLAIKYGKPYIYMDKGYCRNARLKKPEAFIRFSPNSWQPLKHLDKFSDRDDRWEELLKIPIRKWYEKDGKVSKVETLEPKPHFKEEGEYILFAGSSAKYHLYMGIEEPTTYTKNIVKEIRQLTDRPIIYRPKPSWNAKQEVEGTIFLGDNKIKYHELLKKDLYCVITHTSNAALEANFYGIPTIVLGEAIAKPVSSTKLDGINNIYRPTLEEKHSLGRSLSYFQYRIEEVEDGVMFDNLKGIFEEELNGS
tara:strand:- start:2750 stop:3691 length:942 start_codon:yes stop_codon:yes gene_type:complete